MSDKENEVANSMLGIRFAHLGRKPEEGLDCLGCIQEFYLRAYGIDLSENISAGWCEVQVPLPGDVAEIRFYQNKLIDHCAVYLGGGMMLHASENVGVVRSKVMIYRHKIARWMRHESRNVN